MMRVTYLSDTTTSSDHRISDTMPTMFGASSLSPLAGSNTVLMVYSGLVPMSPNTMPIAPRVRPGSLDAAGRDSPASVAEPEGVMAPAFGRTVGWTWIRDATDCSQAR